MTLSLQQAAEATGKEKSTISRAIKSGRMSGIKTEKGNYEIDPAELFRVFAPKSATGDKTGQMQQKAPVQIVGATKATDNEIRELRARLELLGEERTREREQLETTIQDLRDRLDKETTERRKLTALLTYQPEPTTKQQSNQPPLPLSSRSPWGVVLAVVAVVVSILALVVLIKTGIIQIP